MPEQSRKAEVAVKNKRKTARDFVDDDKLRGRSQLRDRSKEDALVREGKCKEVREETKAEFIDGGDVPLRDRQIKLASNYALFSNNRRLFWDLQYLQ